MFKLIKWLFIIAVVVIVVLWVTGYKIGGRSVPDYVKGLVGAKAYDEGVKDMRSLVGEAVKAVGEAISPEVTTEEKKELENVIKKEMGATTGIGVPAATTGAQPAPRTIVPPPTTPATKTEGGK